MEVGNRRWVCLRLCPHCSIVAYITRGMKVIRRAFSSGISGVCAASGICIKNLRGLLGEGLGEVIRRRGSRGVVLALYVHTKFEVSSFSRSGDTRQVPIFKSRSRAPQTPFDLICIFWVRAPKPFKSTHNVVSRFSRSQDTRIIES